LHIQSFHPSCDVERQSLMQFFSSQAYSPYCYDYLE
jgi:hypothetical protein